MNIDIFDNFDNCENDNCENDNWENEFYNNELYNLIKRCITFFFMINTFYHMMVMLYYYFDVEPFATYLYNDTTKFITNLQNGLSEKLLKYNGHFSDFDKLPLQFFQQKNFPEKFIFSFSCHNLKSALKAQKSGFDMIFISPIFPTTSHLNTKNMGLKNLAKISLKTKNINYLKTAVYALGGINESNILSIRKLNLAGFAAISLFLRT